MTTDPLFKLLADPGQGPGEQLHALAAHIREAFNPSYLEIRLDGLAAVRMGECPEEVCRQSVGSADRPVGEITVAPPPADRDAAVERMSAFARCAEIIHRLQSGYIDNLTGLYNRRRLDMELTALAVSGDPVAVAMLDIDHFKRVNDTHGHDAGDEVLRQFASRLAESLPAGGFLSRYGGEEFCVILRNLDEEAATSVVEGLRASASAAPVLFRKQDIRITSSAGVAAGTGRRAGQLMKRADEALYAAKSGGRNQLVRSAEMSCRNASTVFRRRFRRILDRPLGDLAWFGQRVIGLDRSSGRLMLVDFFGGVFPVSRRIPDALSFARVGPRTVWVPASGPGVRLIDSGSGSSAPGDYPELRRVHHDARLCRLYLIERRGCAVFQTDLSFSRLREIPVPDAAASGNSARGITALLSLGHGLLVLDALARRIFVLDRAALTLKHTWELPGRGYEICLCYLPSLKLILAGGADGLTFFSLDGRIAGESDQPVISAYDHPLVGLVMATPDGTVLVR